MNTKDLFHRDVEETRKSVFKTFERTVESIEEDVKVIREWLQSQSHLPEVTSNAIIERFFIINKCSVELTKEKIDMYYSVRSLIPELYENKNPALPQMQQIADVVYCIPLPKLTCDLNRVTVIKLNDKNPNKFEACDFFAHTFNINELKLTEEYSVSDILVYDLEDFTLAHMLKITPILLKKVSVVVEKVYSNRIKEIHLMNCPIVEPLVKLMKTFLNPKLTQRIYIHKDPSFLLQHFCKTIIPKDYGGDEISLCELNELWKEKMVDYKERFDKLDTMRVNETLRPTPLINDDILGFHGNFKKLNVD